MLHSAIWAFATSERGIIRIIADYKRLAQSALVFGLNSGGERARIIDGGRAADQNAPERRVSRTKHDMRRAVTRFHFRPQAFGVRTHLKSTHLYGKKPRCRERGHLRDLDTHARGSRTYHIDGASGRVGKVDDAVAYKGTAIINADVDGFVVIEIYNMHESAEGQRAVRGGELLHVVDFAVGSRTPVIRMAIPTRDSDFHARHRWRNRGRYGCPNRSLFPTGGKRQSEQSENASASHRHKAQKIVVAP